jgi:hypothetical protein
MQLRHIGVLRLHELAAKGQELNAVEMDHLDLCEGCLKVFNAFRQQLNGLRDDVEGGANRSGFASPVPIISGPR